MGVSTYSEYHLKKKRIVGQRYNTTAIDSVLLYEKEKGPTVTKTDGGTSWSSTQSKISKAQKVKGILNVFGVYDHTNDQMYAHSYKQKTSKQFLDFIKLVDQKYDHSLKQIFLVLELINTQVKQGMRKSSQVPSKNTISISSNKIS